MVSCEWSTVADVATASGIAESVFLAHQAGAGATYMRACGDDVLINAALSSAIIDAQ